MKILSRVEQVIFTTSPIKLYITLWMILLIKSGIWFMPNGVLDIGLLFAQNPFVTPSISPSAHYLFLNWFGPFLAWCLDIKSIFSFFLFHLLFSLGFSWIVFKLILNRLSADAARIAFILFMLLPVSGTAYYWVGMDSITLFLMVLALYGINYWGVLIFAGIALGINHFEQAFLGFGALGFALICSRSPLKWRITTVVLAILLGKFILMSLFHYLNISLGSDRSFLMLANFHALVKEFFYHSQIILWSVLGLGWIIAILYAEQGRKAIPFFIAFGGLLCFLPLIEDQTRVLAIITFPLITVYWLQNEAFLNTLSKPILSLLCLVWIFLPLTWVWAGIPRWSAFPYDIAYLIHHCFGWLNIPSNVTNWPFS